MKRGFSPAATAAFATTMLVLAIIGWSVGWIAGGGATPAAQNSPTTTKSVTPAPKPPSASPSKTATPTSTAVSTEGSIEVPKLDGKKFLEARQQILDLKLWAEIRFDKTSNKPAGTVLRTDPEPKQLVLPGWTINVYVAGAPPKVNIPDRLVGLTCTEAKNVLVLDNGFHIASYPSGEAGRVYKVDPISGSPADWGARVTLYCSEASIAAG